MSGLEIALGHAGWPRIHLPRTRDVVAVATVAVVDLLLFSGVVSPWRGIAVVAFGLLGFIPLLWRASVPIQVFCVICAFMVICTLWVPPLRPTLALLVALYTVTSRCRRRVSVVTLAVAVPLAAATSIRGELFQDPSASLTRTTLALGLFSLTLTLGAWALGLWAYTSRRRMQDLEASRAAAAAAARAEERRLIALELHDIVSHSVSVMVLQADGARAVLSVNPAQADSALEHIGEVGRESVAELRRLLGVLTDGTIAPVVERQAQLGLTDIPAVLKQARRSGLSVSERSSGHPPALPQSFERSVHRIVKESLANSLKHSGPGTSVDIRFVWSRELLILEIADNGRGTSAHPELSSGYGLAGLRERASALDGRLEAGLAEDGAGYLVRATLPIPTPAGNRSGPGDLEYAGE